MHTVQLKNILTYFASIAYVEIICRYDGLYRVVKVFDVEGNATDNETPRGNEQYTFFLERLPAGKYHNEHHNEHHNELSIDDLCHKINTARLDANDCFAVPRPQPLYDQLFTLSNITTEGDKKKTSFPSVDIAPSPGSQPDDQCLNMHHHRQSSTNDEFHSNTPTQYPAKKNLQQAINLSHALCPADFSSAPHGTFQSSHHFGCHELNHSRYE